MFKHLEIKAIIPLSELKKITQQNLSIRFYPHQLIKKMQLLIPQHFFGLTKDRLSCMSR